MYNEVLKNNEIVHDLTYDHLKKKVCVKYIWRIIELKFVKIEEWRYLLFTFEMSFLLSWLSPLTLI